MPADTVAHKIREPEAEIAKLEARLCTPRPAPPNIGRRRTALTLRAEQWKADLRAEPKVARLVLRRLVGPLTLWGDDAEQPERLVRWEAPDKAEGLLDGLVHEVASPTGGAGEWNSEIRASTREAA